jgi:hypothetical protein
VNNLRRISSLILAGAIPAVVSMTAAVPAHADGGFVTLTNFGSGKCAGVNPQDNYFANGARVQQQTCNEQPEQNWLRIGVGDGYYKLVNQRSGQCMDVRNGQDANRVQVQQWTCTNTRGMKWRITRQGVNGSDRVTSQIGGRCLDVDGGSLADGAKIQIYACTSAGNTAQSWIFN